jgi:hypothetical protein
MFSSTIRAQLNERQQATLIAGIRRQTFPDNIDLTGGCSSAKSRRRVLDAATYANWNQRRSNNTAALDCSNIARHSDSGSGICNTARSLQSSLVLTIIPFLAERQKYETQM